MSSEEIINANVHQEILLRGAWKKLQPVKMGPGQPMVSTDFLIVVESSVREVRECKKSWKAVKAQ